SLVRVTVSLTNTGVLPTVNAIGRKTRRLAPTVIELEAVSERLVGGERVQRFDSIAGGETVYAEWLVVAGDGGGLTARVRSPRFGDREIGIEVGR
ncbi:MAG: hypothetical protein CMJ31_04725, partial [Phycisphaerae bacterium]|nr:hypothetical protein [Phycisphaerae bacterium]